MLCLRRPFPATARPTCLLPALFSLAFPCHSLLRSKLKALIVVGPVVSKEGCVWRSLWRPPQYLCAASKQASNDARTPFDLQIPIADFAARSRRPRICPEAAYPKDGR